MNGLRWIAGVAGVAGIAALVAVAPAAGSTDNAQRLVRRAPVAATGFGSFTPAAADPRLAAVFARGGLGNGDFRFTPSETRRNARAVTVAVRARSARGEPAQVASSAPTVGLAPIAYNLGVSVGWKRFALSGDVAHVDLAGQPGSREAADLALSYSAGRISGQVKAGADRALADAPRLTDPERSYSLDVGGSYSLTRNLDVTAGLRYKSDRDRLARVDDRRDSQAVYVGTAFRF